MTKSFISTDALSAIEIMSEHLITRETATHHAVLIRMSSLLISKCMRMEFIAVVLICKSPGDGGTFKA